MTGLGLPAFLWICHTPPEVDYTARTSCVGTRLPSRRSATKIGEDTAENPTPPLSRGGHTSGEAEQAKRVHPHLGLCISEAGVRQPQLPQAAPGQRAHQGLARGEQKRKLHRVYSGMYRL